MINARGTRLDRKLVVIESDDWGSIRMPSREVFNRLQAEGHHPETDPYMRFDALESDLDLERLFEVLGSVKDKWGKPAVITANAVVANPDFARIEEEGFAEYYYEPFTETCNRYEGRGKVLSLWKEGLSRGIFVPQYHGREHLHVGRWMRDLQQNDALMRKAFANRMISISSEKLGLRFGYMEGLDYFNEQDRLSRASILRSGHQLFRDLVGYGSRTFIANCYIWDSLVEEVLVGEGVQVMQGIFNQLRPDGNGTHTPVRHYMGQRSVTGMKYTVRNVFFEPSLYHNNDWVDEAMSRIAIAFLWKKPAIIGSHRLNYISSIDPMNGEQNLRSLGRLLNVIVRKWPDVEFVSSADLAELL